MRDAIAFLFLGIAMVCAPGVVFPHELESPGVIFAEADGSFAGEFTFRAGPNGSVPLHVEIFFGPNTGDVGVAGDWLCTAHFDPGAEVPIPISGHLEDPTASGSVRAFLSTECPGDPEPGILSAQVTIIPRIGGPCEPSPEILCLQEGRFQVEAEWEDFRGGNGSAGALPLAGSTDSGLFWFFAPGNVELLVKVLDGCALNGHFWVFLASASTVAYEVRVTDLRTNEVRTYRNQLGEIPSLVPDTSAFGGCSF